MAPRNIKTLESEIKMPLMSLPIKSTLVSLKQAVVLISPLPKLQNFKDQIDGFGSPTDIVAPNGFHHLGVNQAAKMYPSARLWGVPALKSKRQDVQWTGILPEAWPYQGELDVYLVKGMPKTTEAVFYHHESKTLIVADLFFNHVHGKGFGYWLVFHLFGTYRRFAVSKFFMKFIKNQNQFKTSVQKLLSLDIERIIIPHGEDVVDNVKEKLQQAFKERNLI